MVNEFDNSNKNSFNGLFCKSIEKNQCLLIKEMWNYAKEREDINGNICVGLKCPSFKWIAEK